jgi:tetratricopeptide (TPR) repeat protein
MDAIRQGLSDSLHGRKGRDKNGEATPPSPHSAKAGIRPAVSVSELRHGSDEEAAEKKQLARQTSSTTASVNGSAHESSTVTTTTTTNTNTMNGTAETGLGRFDRVRDVFRSVTSLIGRSADYSEQAVKETDLHAYLHFISDERLIHMPRRGSDWDRVLSNAQFFGLQVWLFGKKIESYIPGGRDSAAAALASCQVLLETGHAQAPALLPTFVALYELAMLLSPIGQLRGLESMPAAIREKAADIFCDLVSLSGSIAVHYRQKMASLRRTGLSAAVDFDEAFGQQISDIWRGRQKLYDQIWAHKLGRKRLSMSVQALRRKLQQDEEEASVRSTLYDEVTDSLERSEDTCHWIKHQLASFLQSGEQVLSVTGPAGSGKTMLAEWVQERLSRPLDHQSYLTLDYTFASDSPEEATALACVKSLLNQLLDRSVGDVSLYENLVHAFDGFASHHNVEKLEKSLWDALRGGLQVAQRENESSVVIITDGCDGITGGDKAAVAFHTALRQSVSKVQGARVITFSRPVSHLSDGCRHVLITHQELYEDIRVHLSESLAKSAYFHKLDAGARDELLEELAAKAKGSFLWAYFAGRLLQGAKLETYAQVKKTLVPGPDVSNVLQQLVGEARLKGDETLRLLLSFMIVTRRPLSVQEFAELLSINTSKRTVEKQAVDLLKYVPATCGDIVIIRGGHLHFRSSLVKTYLTQQMGNTLLSLKDAHSQLLHRVLLYARLRLRVDREPLLEGADDGFVDQLFSTHHLLLYVVQSWTVHFKEAGLLGSDGKVVLVGGFADYFPDTVTFALIERTYWHRSYTVESAIGLHELALKVREATFSRQHVTVLQTLLTLSQTYRFVSTTSIHSTSYLVQAVRLGLTLFSATSVLVSACVSLVLTWTETTVVTERTEIVTYREEMMRVMITICKHKYGHSSDEVIRWYERLAKLYIDIGEKQQATIIYREYYEVVVQRYGRKSDKAREIGGKFGTLDVVLKGEDAVKDVGGLEKLIFETNEDLEASDKMSITMTIRLAQSYIASGRIYLAERLYLTIWRRVTALCTADARAEIHIAKIQIALEYVKFLRTLNRSEEASNILICLWAEYEHYTSQVETLTIWIREIGVSCKSFGLLTIAASILTKVWGWFKSKGKVDDEEAQKTTLLITEVVEEITETTITKKTTKITTTEVTETAVRDIFEVHFTRCQKNKVDRAFFSSCLALIGLYMQDNRWSEAETVLKRSLEISWKAVLTADVKVTLSAHSSKETIVVARRLAQCYAAQGLFDQAEFIYLRIYHACLGATTIDEVTLSESVSILVAFYEQHHRHDKVIETYILLLERYRKQHGATHRLTIQTLYLVAAQCEILGRADAAKYYLEIVTVLNKGTKHCHHDAIKAALFLVRYYHARKQWTELRGVCESVWETIVLIREGKQKQQDGWVWDVAIITEIYEKYTYVLEVHVKVEFSILYKISVQYKEVTVAVAGASSSAALLALIALAKICEKNESHYHESVTIYEEVLTKVKTVKTTETIITETTIRTVKTRLSKLYVTVITTGKAGPTKPSVERAIELTLEAYAHLKIEFGCWHEKTLLKLKEVVILYQKVSTQEAHLRITQLLQASVVEIITTVTVTASLFAAAKTLASIYITAGQVSKGQDLLHQLRYLVIFRNGGGWTSTEVTLKLDAHVSSKAVFSFLIAFELGLSGKTSQAQYSELMADIVFEVVLFEEYTRVVDERSKSGLEVILERGAKLRVFWEHYKRTQLIAVLDKKLLQLFTTTYASAFEGVEGQHVRVFYLALIAELARDQRATNIDLSALACRAGNAKVRALLEAGDLHQAHLVGRCVFRFGSSLQLYRQVNFIQHGYKLAELLAGTELALPSGPKHDEVRKAMLQTSKEIMAQVLTASHAADIDFARLQFEDLAGLLRLLGAQGNYAELVIILSRLWACREELQKLHGWSPSMVFRIGTLLIHAQQGSKDFSAATATAELLYYNIRRGRGRLDPETLAMSRLLASLYITNGRATNAVAVHKSVLSEIASACQEHESNRPHFAAETKLQLEGLKGAYTEAKNKGKVVSDVQDLYNRVKATTKVEGPAYEQWMDGKAVQNIGYSARVEWNIEQDVKHHEMWKRSTRERPKLEGKGFHDESMRKVSWGYVKN